MKSILACILTTVIFYSSKAQDQIIKTNGEEILGKVIKVSTIDIVYKKKENIDGPEYSELKANILLIKYENGIKEVFTTANTPVINNQSSLCAPIKRKNSVFLEGGGNGLFGSINYERRFFGERSNNFATLKLGLGPFVNFNTINLTSTYNVGDGMNFFEFGGGLGVYAAGAVGSYRQENSYLYFTPTLGYRRQSAGGFMFRTFLTMLTIQDVDYQYNDRTGSYTTDQYGYSYYQRSPPTIIISYRYYPFLGFSIGYSF